MRSVGRRCHGKGPSKAAHLTCDKTWETCPNVVSVKILDAETGQLKTRFYRGGDIKFEVQVLNPDAVEHVMNLRIYMDDDPEDAEPGVVNNQHITVPAYGYATGQFVAVTPNNLPDGWIYVSIELSDDTCTTVTPYSYSFYLGTAPPPIPWVADEGIFSTDKNAITVEWGADDPQSSDIKYYTLLCRYGAWSWGYRGLDPGTVGRHPANPR